MNRSTAGPRPLQAVLSRRQVLLAALATGSGLWSQRSAASLAASWTPRADMPFPIQEIYPAAIEINGKPLIVNAGGLALRFGDPAHAATVIYDPEADTWSDGVPLPETRHHLALVWDGQVLHAMGGFTRHLLNAWEMRTEHWVTSDPRSEPWRLAEPMPGPRGESVNLFYQGQIHVICGRIPEGDANGDWNDHTDTGLHWVFDVAREVWEERRPLPDPCNSSTGAVVDGKLYIVGGRTVTAGTTPACHRYDPSTDQWESIAPLPPSSQVGAPAGQAGLAGAVSAGRLCVFGGEWFDEKGGGVYADAWVYEPDADRWQHCRPGPGHDTGSVPSLSATISTP